MEAASKGHNLSNEMAKEIALKKLEREKDQQLLIDNLVGAGWMHEWKSKGKAGKSLCLDVSFIAVNATVCRSKLLIVLWVTKAYHSFDFEIWSGACFVMLIGFTEFVRPILSV